MSQAAALSRAVATPAHIPESVVYDFDMFRDPAYLADPHARVLDLVRTAPAVFWTPRNGGHWMLISHAANFKAARDIESFTSQFVSREQAEALQAMMPPGTHIPNAAPINLDPPEHGQYRAPLQQAFSPKAMLALKDEIRTLANQLIDNVIDRGRCDLMVDIAEPLPVRVFLKLLGLPLERQDEYRALVVEHLSDAEPARRRPTSPSTPVSTVASDHTSRVLSCRPCTNRCSPGCPPSASIRTSRRNSTAATSSASTPYVCFGRNTHEYE
jgi:cytochrome P450